MNAFVLHAHPFSSVRAAGSSDIGWLAAVHLSEDGVEAAEAAEAGTFGNFGRRQIGVVEQPLHALYARGLCDLNGARAEMLLEEPAQMPRSDARRVSSQARERQHDQRPR
jgi:hypothetical protein